MKNSAKAIVSFVLFAMTSIKNQNTNNIFKNKSHVDLNKSKRRFEQKLLWRLRNRMNTMQFKIEKTIKYSNSIRLTSIQSNQNCECANMINIWYDWKFLKRMLTLQELTSKNEQQRTILSRTIKFAQWKLQ